MLYLYDSFLDHKKHIILSVIVLAIANLISVVGKGVGNFYVLAMVLAGVSMHEAAPVPQLIMLGTSVASVLIFHKNKKVDWKLAQIIDPPTDIMAFVGGYYASSFEGYTLKLMFAGMLILVSIFILMNVKDKPMIEKRGFG